MSKFADLDNEDIQPEESTGGARISTAGIHGPIKVHPVEYTEFKGKGKNAGKTFKAARFKFENNEGEIHEELYFEPPTDEADIKWQAKKYTKVDGKNVESGKVDNATMVKLLNNDLVYFILDLVDALGFSFDKAKALIQQCETFEDVVKLFNKSFSNNLEKKRIWMKLLWENNDKAKTSYLKLKGLLSYYPIKADIFDVYVDGRKSILFINDWEKKQKGSAQFDNSQAPKSGDTTVAGNTSSNSYDITPDAGSEATGQGNASDEDPF